MKVKKHFKEEGVLRRDVEGQEVLRDLNLEAEEFEYLLRYETHPNE